MKITTTLIDGLVWQYYVCVMLHVVCAVNLFKLQSNKLSLSVMDMVKEATANPKLHCSIHFYNNFTRVLEMYVFLHPNSP